ncbi:MAG: STM4012 family radical SAM protein [Cellulosilyticaceae bacterium]
MKKLSRYHQYMYSYPHKSAYRPMDREMIGGALRELADRAMTLYIHIPFCSSKCGYCNLFSVATQSEEMVGQYVDAVCRQIVQYGKLLEDRDVRFTTLVIGGGTPLILSIAQMEQLFGCIEACLPIVIKDSYFVIETSPNETSREKLEYLKAKGVNRLSIGIQSFAQEELDSLYRRHSTQQCHHALEAIGKVGFDAVNVDLIYGISGQSLESFEASLSRTLDYGADEMFLYPLYIREHTGLYQKMVIDEALQYQMYLRGCEILGERGYTQTSMRRFTKRLQETHRSCGFEQMLALGCGGRSYVGNLHFCEPYEVEPHTCRQIIKAYSQKEDFLEGVTAYRLSQEEIKRRYIIKNLGYYQGIDLREYEEVFGEKLETEDPYVPRLLREGLAKVEQGKLKLTTEGVGQSDWILGLWVSEEVQMRMKKC